MTTRRARLQIRPNIGRGTGNDVLNKKTTVASKCLPKKEGKENAKIEESNITEQLVVKVSPSGKDITQKDINGTSLNSKDNHNGNIQNGSSPPINVENVAVQKNTVASENYNRLTLFSMNRECTVVLDRNIIAARKKTELKESCSASSSAEGSSKAESATTGQLHEKEKESCRERTPSSDSQQTIPRSELSDRQSLNVSCIDTDKEKKVKSKESIPQEGISTDSSALSQCTSDDNAFVKPIVQCSTVTSPERRPSNKTCNSEETSKRRNRFNRKPPERGSMTMMDLIFWNPPNNPMSQEKRTEDIVNEADVSVLRAVEDEEEVDAGLDAKDGGISADDSSKAEAEELPGPRVMVGPNGDITIDEDSLVIRRTDPEKIASKKVVHEVEACTYNSFRKQKPKQYWSARETAKFYKALSILGTDFSLMLSFFPNRSRQELKNKFKREERLNRHLVDRAIRDPQQFDLSAFDDDDNDDVIVEGTDDPNDADFDIKDELRKTRNNKTRKKYKKRKVKNKDSLVDEDSNDWEVLSIDNVPQENLGTRKSTRKRKETSKEIITHSSEPDVKKRRKPRVSKPKKRREEEVPVENESLEVVEVSSENLEVLSEDQSIILCHGPLALACEETPNSDVQISVTEAEQSKQVIEPNVEKDSDRQQDIRAGKVDSTLQQLNVSASVISNNILQSNLNQSNLIPGQIVLVPGKTDNANEQIVHVYVVSPPHCSEQLLLPGQQNSESSRGAS